MARGQAYLSYSWQARGIGYADTVSNQGWKLLAERLNIAAEALEAAWKLNPHDARICREMMRVELGQGKGRERLELWFNRGMSVDPGNHDLCSEKIEYLRPRWYGSIDQMIQFGRECTTNVNWKGPAMLMLAEAHYEASREIQDRNERIAYWKKPEVWADIRFSFERFFKLYPEAVDGRHKYAYYAYLCGQWGEFDKQIKLLPSTNLVFFGGAEKFNSMVLTAEAHLNGK